MPTAHLQLNLKALSRQAAIEPVEGVPSLMFPPIPDVDTMADLYHNVTLVEALNYCAKHDDICPPWRTAQALSEIGFSQIYVAPNDLRDPRDEIDR